MEAIIISKFEYPLFSFGASVPSYYDPDMRIINPRNDMISTPTSTPESFTLYIK
jgi:hypothetical protein